jgi:hypothetical protein
MVTLGEWFTDASPEYVNGLLFAAAVASEYGIGAAVRRLRTYETAGASRSYLAGICDFLLANITA